MNRDLVFCPPGELSKSGVLDLGRRCAHSCRFCYYSFMSEDGEGGQFGALRRAPFRSVADSLAIVDRLADHGLINFDITGGEPTMHPGLPDMVARAVSRALSVRVITLGQFLVGPGGPRLLDRLLAAGTTDFLFSLHAATEETFQQATGGSLARVLAAMDALDRAGFQYTANTVVHAGNLDELPRIAALSAGRGVYHHNFIVFNAYYRWNSPARVAGMQAGYPAMAEPLRRAVAILDAAGVAVTLRYLPLCVVPDLARHVAGVVGVHHDPHEWMNRAGNEDKAPDYCAEPLPVPRDGPRDLYALTRGDWRLDWGPDGGLATVARRGDAFKIFPPACAACAAMASCDGLDPKYLVLHGAAGLTAQGPDSPLAQARPPLLAERRAYLPAFALKRAPLADMRGVLARVLGRRPLAADAGLAVVVAPGPEAALAATAAALTAQGIGQVLAASPEPGGAADPGTALNRAVAGLEAGIVAVVPAGTVPEPGWFDRAVAALRRHPEKSLVVAGAGCAPDFQALLDGDAAWPVLLGRREAFMDGGGFGPGLTDCLFWDFRLRAMAAGHFALLLPGAGEGGATPAPVDRHHPEFPRVLARNRLVFPRELSRRVP